MAEKNLLLILYLLTALLTSAQDVRKLDRLLQAAQQKYSIPALELDYRDNMAAIQPVSALKAQQLFFDSLRKEINRLNTEQFSDEEQLLYRKLVFEIDLNLERLKLSYAYHKDGFRDDGKGFFGKAWGKQWYCYYIKRFTGLNQSPEDIVRQADQEIHAIRDQLHALSYLKPTVAFFYNTDSIVNAFSFIDQKVRSRLAQWLPVPDLPPVKAMPWPDAQASTPPGIYLNSRDNAYGSDVFLFNFSGSRMPKGNLDWLYLHEAIPGHHYQRQFLGNKTFYTGSSEGWACYVEVLGEKLGLYNDLGSKIAALKWALVRSVRLKLETGIHYFGWNYEACLSFWNEHIQDEPEMARREINRVTHWPAQSLSYRLGAVAIAEIVKNFQAKGMNSIDAHHEFLKHCNYPLQAFFE